MFRGAGFYLLLLKSITSSFVFEELSTILLSEHQAVSFWLEEKIESGMIKDNATPGSYYSSFLLA